jgi:OmcA/MtrC family decaheme c-type cytochrome
MCHNPNKLNDTQSPRFQVPSTVVQSMNFKVMVHKLHRGNQLAQGYTVGSEIPTAATPGGVPLEFGTVAFPGNLKACWACHTAASYFLPLTAGQLPTKWNATFTCNDSPANPAQLCSLPGFAKTSERVLGPVASACMACHDKPSSIAHADVMTATDGNESCETCHGLNKPWDLQVAHTLLP